MCFNFFSSYVLGNERKESQTLNTFDLMLEPIVVNSKKTLMPSSMKNSKKVSNAFHPLL
jgi:hypothetical protein